MEGSVTIPLEDYKKLLNYHEANEAEIEKKSEERAIKKILESSKYTLMIDVLYGHNDERRYSKEIIINDQAVVECVKDGVKREKQTLIEQQIKAGKCYSKYIEAVDQIKSIKWYDLLFKTKKANITIL